MQEQLAPVSTIANTVEFDASLTVIEIVNIGFLVSNILTVYFSRPCSSSHSSSSELPPESYSSELDKRRSKYFSLPEPFELTEVSSGKVVSEASFSLSLLAEGSFNCSMLTCLLVSWILPLGGAVANLTVSLSHLSSCFFLCCLGTALGDADLLLVLCIDLVSFFNFSCDLPKVFCHLSISSLFSARAFTLSWICAHASGVITP